MLSKILKLQFFKSNDSQVKKNIINTSNFLFLLLKDFSVTKSTATDFNFFQNNFNIKEIKR